MEIPFLKNKTKYKNMGGGGPATEERSPDSSSTDQMLSQVAQELLDALTKKDRAALKESLQAFTQIINSED